MLARWEAAGRRCESCARPIPDPSPTNFAHRKGRNLSTAEEIENGFFVVCEDLHRYEHTRARNLIKNPCVDSYVALRQGLIDSDSWPYGKQFWPDRLEYSP